MKRKLFKTERNEKKSKKIKTKKVIQLCTNWFYCRRNRAHFIQTHTHTQGKQRAATNWEYPPIIIINGAQNEIVLALIKIKVAGLDN